MRYELRAAFEAYGADFREKTHDLLIERIERDIFLRGEDHQLDDVTTFEVRNTSTDEYICAMIYFKRDNLLVTVRNDGSTVHKNLK